MNTFCKQYQNCPCGTCCTCLPKIVSALTCVLYTLRVCVLYTLSVDERIIRVHYYCYFQDHAIIVNFMLYALHVLRTKSWTKRRILRFRSGRGWERILKPCGTSKPLDYVT